jgi:hypothetical protein
VSETLNNSVNEFQAQREETFFFEDKQDNSGKMTIDISDTEVESAPIVETTKPRKRNYQEFEATNSKTLTKDMSVSSLRKELIRMSSSLKEGAELPEEELEKMGGEALRNFRKESKNEEAERNPYQEDPPGERRNRRCRSHC